MKTLTWQKPGQQNVAQELIKIIINYVAELRVNQLSCDHEIEYGKKTGDFKVNGKYTLEVDGEGKTYNQIADVPDSYILADGIETPYRCKLPIWVVGFLY